MSDGRWLASPKADLFMMVLHFPFRRAGRGERLMVTGFYSLRDNTGQTQSEVGVLPAMYEKRRFFSSVIAAQLVDKVNTGVAIVNTSDQDATVTLTLRGVRERIEDRVDDPCRRTPDREIHQRIVQQRNPSRIQRNLGDRYRR